METEEKYTEIEPKPSNGGASHLADPPVSKERPDEEDDIDLAVLLKEIWLRRKTVFIVMLGALAIGIFIALASPEEYSANIVLMPQATPNSSGNSSNLLRQIGSFGGVSFGSNTGTLDKNLYPDITQSTSFYLSIMNEEMYFPTMDTTMSLYHYFTVVDEPPATEYVKRYTLGLPRMLIRIPMNLLSLLDRSPRPATTSSSTTAAVDSEPDTATAPQLTRADTLYQPITLTGRQLSVMSKLKSRITTTIEENGMVMVSAKMPDPVVAAETTELAVGYLTQYIIDYRVEKVQEDLAFIESQYRDKEERYNEAHQNLATLRDRNVNMVTERARIELDRAETDYNLAFSLYQSLAQQLDQARIKVQEETPVFKVLEPIQVPLSKSEPNQELIIIASLFAGLAIGLAVVVFRIIYSNVKPKFY